MNLKPDRMRSATSSIIVGIDNGLTGGVCALSRVAGLPPIDMFPMPTIVRHHGFSKTKTSKVKGVAKKTTAAATSNEIDGPALVRRIREITNGRLATILIEECPEHARQKSIMRSMAMSYGIIIGAITTGLPECKLVPVRSGNPTDSWQRAMFGNVAKGDTKSHALDAARRLWPNETWLRTPKCKTPDSGLIDAALIAEYGRIKNL